MILESGFEINYFKFLINHNFFLPRAESLFRIDIFVIWLLDCDLFAMEAHVDSHISPKAKLCNQRDARVSRLVSASIHQ